jgi:tetratricopeptide (TPR) repeat protein
MQTDLLLVWSEDPSPTDEASLRASWPQCQRLQELGPNLWLILGVSQLAAVSEPEPSLLPDSCLKQAEQRLAVMRQAGDRPGEATALTDLGIAIYNRDDIKQSLAHFEQALTLARALGDHARESDILGNLALAALAAGQPGRAQQCLEHELAYVRTTGNHFAEKLALERLGTVQASRGNLTASIALLNEALLLTRTLGDHQHEADLLWHLAIRHVEFSQREQAMVHAQAAVDLLQRLGKLQARVYAEHLQRYRLGELAADLTGTGEARPSGLSDWSPGVALVTTVTTAPLVAEPVAPSAGPGLLRMALSAAKALSEFVGSGLQTVSAEVRQKRLRVCAACPHFTGLRCRVCGCFTSAKARLPHEDCPLGQWPIPADTSTRSPATISREILSRSCASHSRRLLLLNAEK